MSKIRSILRCYKTGNGIKRTSVLAGASKNTVKKYIHIYQKCGYGIEDLLKMEDSQLCDIFQEKKTEPIPLTDKEKALQKEMPDYIKKLSRKGMTRIKLYTEYKATHPEGYGFTTFCDKINLYRAVTQPIGHIEHKAGDKMYVDYAGDKLSIIDTITGESIQVETFVAILPCSQLTYIEAVMSQKKEDFIKGCEDAFLFYGGTPEAIVPDNLKAAVTKSGRHESEINEDFSAFAEHYGCAVVPARARKPKDKALVENAVKLSYKTIYTDIDGKLFYDLESLNAAIRSSSEVFNNTKMSGRPYSRRERFEEIEKECLGPLNPLRFEIKQRKTVTVGRNSFFILDRHHYSVDKRYAGRRVNLIYNAKTIEVFYNYNKITEHKRSYIPYEYTQLEEHRLPGQRSSSDFSISAMLAKGLEIHPAVSKYMTITAERRKYPELAFKACRGILSLLDKYEEQRLINACILGIETNVFGYNELEKMLKLKQDNIIQESADEEQTGKMPKHGNIHGKEYFNTEDGEE